VQGKKRMKYQPNIDVKEIVKKDYKKKIIFSQDDFGEKGHLFQIVTIPPSTKQRKHFHDIQTEFFYIFEGQAVITINAKDYLAKPGDAFIPDGRKTVPTYHRYGWIARL
jgi:uncharacterized cupin superfamily protein